MLYKEEKIKNTNKEFISSNYSVIFKTKIMKKTTILVVALVVIAISIIAGCKNIFKKDFNCNIYIDDKGVYEMIAVCGGCEPTIRVERPELDAGSFKVIDRNYSLDKNHVYYSCRADSILPEADPKTFGIYKKGRSLAYDKEHVFYNDYLVVDGDPNTFTEITTSFHKDKNNVYYVGRKIEGANPEHFRSITYSVGFDNMNIYEDCDKVYEIDINSFLQVNETSWKDKDYYYCLYHYGTGIYRSKESCK